MKDNIKFNDAMLAAVMDGRKTQTRRLIEPQPKVTEDELRNLGAWQDGYTLSEQVCAAWRHGFVDVDCPYGEIGDIINVADKDGNIKGKIEITDVWLQQVNDISENDAKAEGFDGKLNSYISDFYAVWIGIYGIDSWINNEWVWVIEFRRID
ncbi:ASCH domain-containing protein [Proteus mirabilis]|uniref:ASCH domain-containing protein n=1 Tax=Proteus mirabilis TaxID=584 RepID=UPI0029ED543C|nr:ASCH domain-containing protein [Proteus mirabilis]HEK3017770.1 ASCH domain-containing protein [Proteus mirabilis]HEK3117188.1 ASCH domain-containing protein [Proteus mirabilis]